MNREDAYAQQVVISGQCQYFAKYQPLTAELFDAHLNGYITLGLPGIDQDGLCRWCCFDSDKDDGNLDKIQRLLAQHNWHCIREGQRLGRAGHLWMFFDKPILAADLRQFGRRVIELAGANFQDVEFFPKQDRVEYDFDKQRFKVCSVVRLPLGIHRKPGAGERGWFAGVDKNIIGQTCWIQNQPLNPTAPIEAVAHKLRQISEVKKSEGINQRFLFGPSDAEVARVRNALNRIKADDYQTWINVGMALKSAGLSISLWEEWSKTSAKYKWGTCAGKWTTFSNASRISLGTIFYLADKAH